MEENEIFNLVISRMTEEGMWFTTKNDPTFNEAPNYYELDEFGDPTDKTINKIVKEVMDKIGDGAIELEDAIEIWLGDQQANYKIAYTDNLVTEFEPKPVIDQIEAYDKPAEMPLTEGLTWKETCKFIKDEVNKNPDNFLNNLVHAFGTKNVYDLFKDIDPEYIKNLSENLLTPIPDELLKPSEVKPWTEGEWQEYYYRMNKTIREVYAIDGDDSDYIKKQAERFGIDIDLNKQNLKDIADKIATAYADEKEKKYKEVNNLTESKIIKNRLKEENTKSLNAIGDKLSSPDFDADSEDGQITLRTSQLFNELSDNGLEVQVSFDNGESQSTIAVPQGGQINITIRNSNEALRAFISGQVQIDDDLAKTITIVNDVIAGI